MKGVNIRVFLAAKNTKLFLISSIQDNFHIALYSIETWPTTSHYGDGECFDGH